jgi:epoxyqueuosine reductase
VRKTDSHTLAAEIRQEAIRLGFLECGFSVARRLSEHEGHYTKWLSDGHHASLGYMERNIDKRFDPTLLVEGAKTIISLLYNYFTEDKLTGSPLKISKYALNEDYHFVIKEKLNLLDLFIKEKAADATQRYFVDSAPILEKAWAQNSGLGWIGKNSCLVSRQHGSFFFIAEMITSLELEDTGQSLKDYCGSCRKCIDACPTQAITDERTINSNRCISYHTIENRDEIPSELHGKFEQYIFGCDICQDVCPWNKKAIPHSEPLFHLKEELKKMTREDWNELNTEKYQTLFRKSAVKRTKFTGLKRNIEIALIPNQVSTVPKAEVFI